MLSERIVYVVVYLMNRRRCNWYSQRFLYAVFKYCLWIFTIMTFSTKKNEFGVLVVT